MTDNKAILYTFEMSIWASVPTLGLIEKGYHKDDVLVRSVNLLEGENFSPTYLRINNKGTVPTLVVPLLETTGAEVDTKFKAITDSKSILEFLDTSRSQYILQAQSSLNEARSPTEEANPSTAAPTSAQIPAPAPALAPATLEGKALCDELIALVHEPSADPNFLMLGSRSEAEIKANASGIPGTFARNRDAALRKYLAEVERSAPSASENPREATTAQNLIKWYKDKINSETPLVAAYAQDGSASEASAALISSTRTAWSNLAQTLQTLSSKLVLPLALGDHPSLADVHLIAWLARVLSVSGGLPEVKEAGVTELDALQMALQHETLSDCADAREGVSPKLKEYWAAVKTRPSFQEIYKDGLH